MLIAGDLERFIDLVESEALCLQAMMMTSNPHFVLMQPNTLSIIKKVEDLDYKLNCPSVLRSMLEPTSTYSIPFNIEFPL